MKKLPDERTMSELLSMGKDLEDQARKVYKMSEAFAQVVYDFYKLFFMSISSAFMPDSNKRKDVARTL